MMPIHEDWSSEKPVFSGNADIDANLYEHNRQITFLLDTLNDAVFVIDRQWNFTYLNRQAEKLMGKGRTDLIGTIIWRYFPEATDLAFRATAQQVIQENQPATFEAFYEPLAKWFENRIFPTQDGVTVVAHDITERKRAAERLKQSEQDFQTLAESIPQMVWITRADGYHEYFNQHWYDYTRSTLEQTRGEGWIHLLHPDDYERTINVWQHSLQTGEPYDIEYRFRNVQTGEYRWFLGRALAVRDDKGTIIKWFGTCTDINEQKKLEQRKDEFISIASHELKTPITTIKALAQLLKRKLERQGLPEHVASIAKIETSVNKLTRLADDLLDVSKIQAGRLNYAEERVDIVALVRESVETMQQTNTTHTIVLHGTATGSLTGDGDRLGQVFMNLLSNAVKYSPLADKVDVWLEQMEKQVLIRVQDYGVGIPQEHQSQIFERFYRVYDQKNMAFPGLGMGLYIASEIVKRHNGDITVSSEEGVGTIFTVSLPLA